MVLFSDMFHFQWTVDFDIVHVMTFCCFVVICRSRTESNVYRCYICVFSVLRRDVAQQIHPGLWTEKTALDLEVSPVMPLSIEIAMISLLTVCLSTGRSKADTWQWLPYLHDNGKWHDAIKSDAAHDLYVELCDLTHDFAVPTYLIHYGFWTHYDKHSLSALHLDYFIHKVNFLL